MKKTKTIEIILSSYKNLLGAQEAKKKEIFQKTLRISPSWIRRMDKRKLNNKIKEYVELNR